jgi:molybdenum cofactor biosynthesis enzyme MoaA
LRLCLFSKGEIALKPALRPALNVGLLENLFKEAVSKKPKSLRDSSSFGRKMPQIGG